MLSSITLAFVRNLFPPWARRAGQPRPALRSAFDGSLVPLLRCGRICWCDGTLWHGRVWGWREDNHIRWDGRTWRGIVVLLVTLRGEALTKLRELRDHGINLRLRVSDRLVLVVRGGVQLLLHLANQVLDIVWRLRWVVYLHDVLNRLELPRFGGQVDLRPPG